MTNGFVRAASAAALSASLGLSGASAGGQGGAAAPAAALDRVPAPFREAVGAELKAGLALGDARDAAVAGGAYLAVIYDYPEAAKEHGGDKALKLYFAPAGSKAVKATDLYTEHLIDFGTYEDPGTVFADVNRDGATDLIVSAANGGNCWQCSRVIIYSLDGPEPRVLVSEPMSLKDLDGDGRMELLVGDTRWEGYDDFSHAAAPGGTLVYKWSGDTYVFAGADAADFYRSEADRIQADLPDAIKNIDAAQDFGDEQYVSDAISLYLIAVYTGQAERGAEEFRRMMGEHVLSEAMRKHRKQILDDFLAGDSAKLLATPKKGDAIPKASGESRQ